MTKNALRLRLEACSRFHVVGCSGTEGAAAVSFLAARFGARRVAAHDVQTDDAFATSFFSARDQRPRQETAQALRAYRALPVQWRLGGDYLSGIAAGDALLLPQDWDRYGRNREPVERHRRNRGLVLLSFDLYYLYFAGTIIGITGTKGKTTTCHLARNLLAAAGREVYISGNDRFSKQILPHVDRLPPSAYLILETSNRHLKHSLFSPHVAVITNIMEDHLQEHDNNPDAYKRTKLKLLRNQTPRCAVIPGELRLTPPAGIRHCVRVSPAGATGGGTIAYKGKDAFYVAKQGLHLLRIPVTHLPTRLFSETLLSIIGLAACLHLPAAAVVQALRQPLDLRNRFEIIGQKSGITFINDQAATTPTATLRAVQSVADPFVLICGGADKGLDYSALAKELDHRPCRVLLVDSDVAARLLALLRDKAKAVMHHDFRSALFAAYAGAKPGATILLSPAGAHFYSRFVRSGKNSMRVLYRCLPRK